MTDPSIECNICGREGGSTLDCGTCFGRATNQARAYTLSDHRASRVPKEDRYGSDGGLNVRTPNLPGGAIGHPGGRQ